MQGGMQGGSQPAKVSTGYSPGSSSTGSFSNAGSAGGYGFNGGYGGGYGGPGPNDMYPMGGHAPTSQQQQQQQPPMQNQPMQNSNNNQQQAKSDFGLDDLNFDPDTLIGAEGAGGEQTDFGNVSTEPKTAKIINAQILTSSNKSNT